MLSYYCARGVRHDRLHRSGSRRECDCDLRIVNSTGISYTSARRCCNVGVCDARGRSSAFSLGAALVHGGYGLSLAMPFVPHYRYPCTRLVDNSVAVAQVVLC